LTRGGKSVSLINLGNTGPGRILASLGDRYDVSPGQRAMYTAFFAPGHAAIRLRRAGMAGKVRGYSDGLFGRRRKDLMHGPRR
jgi:hypothetical protein